MTNKITQADLDLAREYLEVLEQIAELELPSVDQHMIDQANEYLLALKEISDGEDSPE